MSRERQQYTIRRGMDLGKGHRPGGRRQGGVQTGLPEEVR